MGLFDDIATSMRAAQSRPAGGMDVDSLIAQVLAEGKAQSGAPASETGYVLPKWARDIQLTGRRFNNEPGLFVYMGEGSNTSTTEHPMGILTDEQRLAGASRTSSTTIGVDRAKTAEAAFNLPYTWDDDELAEAMERVRAAGIPIQGFEDFVQVWGSLVDRAGKMYTFSNGEKKVTPWEVLDMEAREMEGSIVDPNRREVQTNKSIAQITEGEAWSSLQQTLSSMLGRDPSDQEVRDFTYRMNQAAASNPSISKTITQYKNGSVDSTRTVTKEAGFGAADVAMEAYEAAQNDAEYAEYTAATSLFNAAVSALGPLGG